MPGVITRKGDAEAMRHSKKLRDVVKKRAEEKDISLEEALLEIQSEGQFSASDADRGARLADLQRESNSGKGWARDALARRVNEKKRELMSRNRELTELAAFRKATEIVLREDRHLLSDYRNDVEKL
jgi:uncharacterized protein with von Willebrand factor type A (vWA) domain